MLGLAAGLFVMVIEIPVIPEKRDELVAATVEHVPTIRAFKGNVSFDVVVDPKRADLVVYVERWETPELQAKFYEWWVAKGMTEKLRPLVSGAPKVSSYTAVQ